MLDSTKALGEVCDVLNAVHVMSVLINKTVNTKQNPQAAGTICTCPIQHAGYPLVDEWIK